VQVMLIHPLSSSKLILLHQPLCRARPLGTEQQRNGSLGALFPSNATQPCKNHVPCHIEQIELQPPRCGAAVVVTLGATAGIPHSPRFPALPNSAKFSSEADTWNICYSIRRTSGCGVEWPPAPQRRQRGVRVARSASPVSCGMPSRWASQRPSSPGECRSGKLLMPSRVGALPRQPSIGIRLVTRMLFAHRGDPAQGVRHASQLAGRTAESSPLSCV